MRLRMDIKAITISSSTRENPFWLKPGRRAHFVWQSKYVGYFWGRNVFLRFIARFITGGSATLSTRLRLGLDLCAPVFRLVCLFQLYLFSIKPVLCQLKSRAPDNRPPISRIAFLVRLKPNPMKSISSGPDFRLGDRLGDFLRLRYLSIIVTIRYFL